jgi:hypothetical protein
VQVASARILDFWLDAGSGEAVVVYDWGEARTKPSELGFKRLRARGWPVKHDSERRG